VAAANLAVFANDLGASFIDPHLNGLAPGRTVAFGRMGAVEAGNLWAVRCPLLLVDRLDQSVSVRLARRLGMPTSRMRERAVEKFLRRHKVDVVLAEYLCDFLEFLPLIERMKLPYVIQGHGFDVSSKLREPGMAERYLGYRSARAVLTRSEFHRRRLIDLGLPAGKVHVNRGGVEIPPQFTSKPSSSARRFLSIGRLTPKKGPMVMLEAFRQAAVQDPELTLDYVGGGPLIWMARQFVDAAGMRDRIRLHGTAPESLKQQLLRECGVFVQHNLTDPETGDEEGLPAAIQEAMAHGLAVVSTRHAGIPEAVIDGTTGILVAEGDAAGMAKAMLDARLQAGAMGAAGYRQASAHDAWQLEQARLKHWLFEAA
jgi:glycosyltransferase involved in cell wall biosynthesis